MTIRISRLHYPVTVLGYGRRVGIWVQGCSIGCSACCSRDTWDRKGGTTVEVDGLVSEIDRLVEHGVDGVTISGGEPFEQASALGALIEAIRRWAADRDEGAFDVLTFTGYTEHVIRRQVPDLVAAHDAIVAGPYSVLSGAGSGLVASGNQRLLRISELGRLRYPAGYLPLSGLQAVVDETGISMIGLPRPGDLERIEQQLVSRGVRLDTVSWR